MGDIHVDYLARHLESADKLAPYFYQEWREIYDARGQDYQAVAESFRSRANIDSLPLALVALHQNDVVGTASLKARDLEVRPELTPWLAGVFVLPDWRGKGIATQLIKRAMDEAKRLRLRDLYLWTPSAESLYRRLGWREVERLHYCNTDIVVMKLSMSAG